MRLSITLIYAMFLLLLGLICAWAVYTSAVSRPYEVRRLDGDTYPTSIAVFDRLHRDAFFALRKAGLQQDAWVEGVDWEPMGGHVIIALASPDEAKSDRIVELITAHPGVEKVTVTVVSDLKARAEARLKADGLDKIALVEDVRGRVPLVKLTDQTEKTSAAVARSLGQVPGLLWRAGARTYFGDLRAQADAALKKAGLERHAHVARAEGRILHVQVADSNPKTAARAIETVSAVPGVLRVQLTKIPLDGDAEVKQAGACNLLLRAIKGGGRIRFLPRGSKIDKQSHPLLDRMVKAINRCKSFVVEVVGHMDPSDGRGRAVRESGNRANAVVDYLVEKGIERRRLRAQARGAREPLTDAATDAGRRLNRRIEFTVISSGSAR
jgi:outer membrane protein OmpA-like peptidoglycan-associated protein